MADNSIPVSKSAHSQNVREAQEYLRQTGYGRDDGMPIVPDGIYGKHTREAVSGFQRGNDLPVTGEIDRATWDKLYNFYQDLLFNEKVQDGITPLPGLDIVLAAGDKGFSIMILQAMLGTIAGNYINIPAVSVNGVYDNNTVQAVKEIQTAAGLEPTGKTDIRTWNTIVRLFNSEVEGEQ